MLEIITDKAKKTSKGGRPRGSVGKNTSKGQRMHLNEMCYNYLVNNFHKFNQRAKQQISLQIYMKTMPTAINVTGDLTLNYGHRTQELDASTIRN